MPSPEQPHHAASGRDSWSRRVSQNSRALDLEPGVFSWGDPHRIAASLWRSAEQSQRRKRSTYGSAMAMLCFYINRAGRNLSQERQAILAQAKQELRRLRPVTAQADQPSTGTSTG